MNRLLKVQLKKVYGKDFKINESPEEFQKFLKLLSHAYDDFYMERIMLENVLEVNSKELTEANQQVSKNHELLRSVTESIDDAVFYKDLELKYIGCNCHFADLVGLSSEAIIGKDDYDLFQQSEADNFRDIDTKLLQNGRPLGFKEWRTDGKGEKRYFSTVKSPLRNAKGETIGIVAVARDITQQHKMEEELASKQLLLIQQGRHASMGEMIGNIAHQWRQPLNALALVIQKIGVYQKRGLLDEEKIDTTIEKSMDLINGMSSTIDDFREFFNPNKEKEPFAVRDAIERAYTIVESVFANHMIEYTLEMPDEIEVNGYKNEFSQVIVNLLNNAKDVLMEKGVSPAKIKINVRKDSAHLSVQVCDNGGGIPDSVIEKIFDPYFSTKDEDKGTGIGLYMSKMIIEDHMKGKLYVSNTDEGACFTIKI